MDVRAELEETGIEQVRMATFHPDEGKLEVLAPQTDLELIDAHFSSHIHCSQPNLEGQDLRMLVETCEWIQWVGDLS